MVTGERLLLLQNIGDDLRAGGTARSLVEVRHEVMHTADKRARELFGLPVDKLLEVIAEQSRLHTAVRGGVAERHLQHALETTPGITRLRKFHQDGPPEFGIELG